MTLILRQEIKNKTEKAFSHQGCTIGYINNKCVLRLEMVLEPTTMTKTNNELMGSKHQTMNSEFTIFSKELFIMIFLRKNSVLDQ